MSNIYQKPMTLTWWQVGIVKLTSAAGAFLIAFYWPVVATWTTFWWVVFIVGALWSIKIYFFKK